MSEKIKVRKFNDLPKEERKKIIYYCEESRIQGMRQVLDKLKYEIGRNQKCKILTWIGQIEDTLEREYEVEDNDRT